VYDFLADSFSLATGAANPDGAKAWLEVVSSVQGQAALNLVKGSIPARTDVDMAGFTDYQKAAAESYSTDVIVGSIQHGAVATVAEAEAVGQAVDAFTADGDVSAFQAALAEVFG
jgi:glucose/mannose transport system substrate-binding protein